MATYEEKLALREQGLAHQQIADILGVSRQAVAQTLGREGKGHFRIIKKDSCIYKGLRDWMNSNRVTRQEFVRRMGFVTAPSTHEKFGDAMRGEVDLRKEWIDRILLVTGLTYEECFKEERQ